MSLRTHVYGKGTLRSVSDPFPHNEPEFFRGVKTLDYQGTEHTRYCPGQLQARAFLATEQAEEAIRPEVFDLLVPPVSREANSQRIDPDRLVKRSNTPTYPYLFVGNSAELVCAVP